MCCAYRIVQEEEGEKKCKEKRAHTHTHTHAKPKNDLRSEHTRTHKNKPGQEWERKRKSERYYCCMKNYFKVFVDAAAAGVFEQGRELSLKKLKGFASVRFFVGPLGTGGCFGEIEHEEPPPHPPSIDDEGEEFGWCWGEEEYGETSLANVVVNRLAVLLL